LLRILLRVLGDELLVAIALFAGAGTLAWWRAWVLLAVLLVVRTAGAVAVYRVNPDLLRERAKLPIRRDQPRTDKLLLLAIIVTGFIALPIIAARDVFRWHVLPEPARPLAALGLVLFAVGWAIQAFVLRTNAFASSVVRLQKERRHTLVDTGPYRVVRHPFYVGSVLVIIGMALWLESYFAALYAVLPIALLMMRIRVEERFLERELPGYREYAARVPHRLIPGIW
jgi:protein-S-isoprenylcysteine O-methyltransferase Ste14